jgi:hypothetical protein
MPLFGGMGVGLSGEMTLQAPSVGRFSLCSPFGTVPAKHGSTTILGENHEHEVL